MKRRGCIDCRVIEPSPGAYTDGRCPSCAEIAANRRMESPIAPDTPKPWEDAAAAGAVSRLRRHSANIAEQYPKAWRQMDEMRGERGRSLPRWPAWCFMPLAGSYAIASGGRNDAPPERLSAIGVLAAIGAWRTTQGIYRFDPTVYQALWDTPLEGEIPTEIMHHFPEWCVYVETPGSVYMGSPSPGFFAFLEHDANDQHEELRLAIDLDSQISVALPIYLDKGGIMQGVQAAQAEAARQASRHKAGPEADEILAIPPEMIAESLAPRVNLLLYLCSLNAEMVERKTGKLKPSKPQPSKTKDGFRLFPPNQIAQWEVGYRLGSAIRAAQEAERGKSGDGTHASPRAHIRRAHWHAFWTGPKAKVGVARTEDRKLVLRWLPPIPVNVDESAAVVPTVHKVAR